jgi:hypothetical protein
MAIVIERTITIKNDKATLDNPIYLYTGDGDITFLFTIKEVKKSARFGAINTTNLVTESASYGVVRIYKPTGEEPVFTTRAEIIDDKLQALFTYEHIDQFEEAGVHQLQIHLYDSNEGERNRFTIPPVELHVLFPIGDVVDTADAAMADYAVIKTYGERLDVLNEDGSYNKTTWVKGDIISSSKLNKVENAIEYALSKQASATFIPSVSASGNISWSNNCGLENPATVNIMGPKGDKGDKGDKGKDGADGTVAFDNLTSAQKASLKGEKGDKGDKGDRGDDFTYADMTDSQKADLTQGFITCSSGITRIEVVFELPEYEEPGVLYIVK